MILVGFDFEAGEVAFGIVNMGVEADGPFFGFGFVFLFVGGVAADDGFSALVRFQFVEAEPEEIVRRLFVKRFAGI